MNISICQEEVLDINVLKSCFEGQYNVPYEELFEYISMKERVNEDFNEGKKYSFMSILKDNETVGFIILKRNNEHDSKYLQGMERYIDVTIIIHQKYRYQKIGKKAMELLINNDIVKPYTGLQAYIKQSNRSSKRLFEGLGFNESITKLGYTFYFLNL